MMKIKCTKTCVKDGTQCLVHGGAQFKRWLRVVSLGAEDGTSQTSRAMEVVVWPGRFNFSSFPLEKLM